MVLLLESTGGQVNEIFSRCIVTVGKRISYYRGKLKLSQAQLAKLIGVDPSTVTYWERDHVTPRPKTLELLLQVFGISRGTFFSDRWPPD